MTGKRTSPTGAKRTTKQKDPLDGAQLPSGKTLEDYMTPAGSTVRPDSSREPWGESTVDLRQGIERYTVLPPRFIWKEGHWKTDNNKLPTDFNTWVVSGEGTPGNYDQRAYILPDDIAIAADPKHPADWTKKQKEGVGWKKPPGSGNSDKSSTKTTTTMPFGLRVRCVGCGHFYKMDDLPGHVKNACPKVQLAEMGFVQMVIECACCDNLQDTAKVIEGWKPITATPTGGEDGDGSHAGERDASADPDPARSGSGG